MPFGVAVREPPKEITKSHRSALSCASPSRTLPTVGWLCHQTPQRQNSLPSQLGLDRRCHAELAGARSVTTRFAKAVTLQGHHGLQTACAHDVDTGHEERTGQCEPPLVSQEGMGMRVRCRAGLPLTLGCCGSIRARHAVRRGGSGPGREKQGHRLLGWGALPKSYARHGLAKRGLSHPLTPVKPGLKKPSLFSP